MNHCGRPEMEEKCTHDCYFSADSKTKECENGLCRIRRCHENPGQEKTLNCCGRKEKDHIVSGAQIICPAAPDAKEWEKEWEHVAEVNNLGQKVRFMLKAFFRSTIEQAEKKEKEASVEFIAVHRDDWMREGAKAERSRISEAIGKLMEKNFGDFVNYHDRVTWTAALDAILKVLHEV